MSTESGGPAQPRDTQRVLAKSSVCEVLVEDDRVTLQIGRLSLELSPVELAALSGSCRTATRRLFERRPPPSTERGHLRLVPTGSAG